VDIPVIERAKIQAQVLVPLLKALQAELGKERANLLGANDPYGSLKTALKAEIDEDAWQSLYSDTNDPSRGRRRDGSPSLRR